MNARRRWLLTLSPLLMFALASCGGKSATSPAGDLTAPFVVSITPGIDATGVAVDAIITVVFSEAMDASTAAGNVTLSSGSITSLTWSDTRTLVVALSGWAEGVEIDVTLGAGLTDLAGNAIEAVFAANFWTQSSVVELLSTNPADGATNALRNPVVGMLFSHDMNIASLNGAITVTNVTGGGTITPILAEGEGTWVTMTFGSSLPASTQIRVNITTAAQSQSGANLSAAASFTFTTGVEVDTEAPTLISVVPANGSVISASTGSIRLTFSEPIDVNAFTPTTLSGQFFMVLAASGVEPTWSQNNTVLTVALATPLPAGLPIVAEFATYQDLSGNVQTTPLNYAVTVSGTPDYFPMADGMVHQYVGTWNEQAPGTTTQGGTRSEWIRFEQDAANQFRMVRYPSEALVGADSWDYYQRTATTIDLKGFHEGSGDEVLFTTPITYCKIPWMAQSWSGTVHAPTGGGTLDVSYSVNVLLQEDVVAPSGGSETLVWKNCWKGAVNYSLSSGGASQGSGSETIWFAPGIGIIKRENVENRADGGVYTSDEVLVTPQL